MKKMVLDDLISNDLLTPLGKSVVNNEVVIDDGLKREFTKALDEIKRPRKYSKDRGVCADW